MKKLIMAAAILGASISSSQAAVMTFNGSHNAKNTVEYYMFELNSNGNVEIVMDTLTDGFDASITLFSQLESTSEPSLPLGTDWKGVAWLPDALRGGPADPVNVYGIPLRNGFAPNDPLRPGTSDPGQLIQNLSAGSYLVVVSESLNDPLNASLIPDGVDSYLSEGFVGFEEFNVDVNPGFYFPNIPHAYSFTVTGDVSQVPLPAAVWMFGSALAGLGAIGRKKAAVAV
jgi:hypothetical protein